MRIQQGCRGTKNRKIHPQVGSNNHDQERFDHRNAKGTGRGRLFRLAGTVEKMLETLGDVVAAELLGDGEITLPGLGKLKARKTAARPGRNPRTGETLQIPAGRKIVFVPFKELKEALNG